MRDKLKEAGWLIADYEQEPGHRPDFLAWHGSDGAVIAARVAAAAKQPKSIEPSTKRLRNFTHAQLISARLIVIPDIRYAKSPDSEVQVIGLRALLKDPDSVFGN